MLPYQRQSMTPKQTGDLSPVISRIKETVGRQLKKGILLFMNQQYIPARPRRSVFLFLSRNRVLSGALILNVGYSPERINPGDKNIPLKHHQGSIG